MEKTTSENTVNSPKRTAKRSMQSSFFIAGIGASAGGLEALGEFLGNVPARSGIGYVIVQHQDPDHDGIMVEILQQNTPMAVQQAKEGMKVQPDRVYVIPPNKDMSILRGTLHLSEPIKPRGLRLPIDYFFSSLAHDRKKRSIGVILSGMGSDGTQGIKAIKEEGGVVAAQAPETARYEGMPRSAANTGLADLLAPVGHLPAKILAFLHTPPSEVPLKKIESSALQKIIDMLFDHSGADFSGYKKNFLYRRVERRMGLLRIDGIDDYVRHLRKNSFELTPLAKELLVGATSFFRDATAWKQLREEAIPALLQRLPYGRGLRAWVPGCSTGEEAYSLAMVFKEVSEKEPSGQNCTMQIFATDVNNDAINKARQGEYGKAGVANVTAKQLRRFFTREDSVYRIKKDIRDMVTFARQDIIKHPPLSKLDIISCRNLLMYMTPELQKNLIPLFHYSLNPGGILFLGNAESTGAFTNLFEGKGQIYIKRPAFAADLKFPPFPSDLKTIAPHEPETPQPSPDIQSLAEQIILERYAPAIVMVSVQGIILYSSRSAGKYLELHPGKADWNVFAMAPDWLRDDLKSGFDKALLNKGVTIQRSLKVNADKGANRVDLLIRYFEKPESLHGTLMILFKEVELADTGKATPFDYARVAQMERKLQQQHNELQVTREEMRTSQEELRTTYEELQSTNEELLSSKQKIQNSSEGLKMVNAEQSARITELSRAYGDMCSLFNSMGIATILVDRGLSIRLVTSEASRLFKMSTTDVGLPLADIAAELAYEDLERDAQEVLESLIAAEKEIFTRDGRWFRVRMSPYRTQEDKIDGVVITFMEKISKAQTLS